MQEVLENLAYIDKNPLEITGLTWISYISTGATARFCPAIVVFLPLAHLDSTPMKGTVVMVGQEIHTATYLLGLFFD